MHPLSRAFCEDWTPRMAYMCAHRCWVHRSSPQAPLLPFYPESGCSLKPHDSASASQLCWPRQPSTLSFPLFAGHPKLEHLLSLALVFCLVFFFLSFDHFIHAYNVSSSKPPPSSLQFLSYLTLHVPSQLYVPHPCLLSLHPLSPT